MWAFVSKPRREAAKTVACVFDGWGFCVCRLRSSNLATFVLVRRSQKVKQARLQPPPAFSSKQIMPIKEKKMCWREQFLTLRSSLIAYTGKEFVDVIIFSLTASPKAATIQALPDDPQPSGRTSPWGGSAPATGPAPAHTKPSSTRQPLCKLSMPETSPLASAATLPARALHLTYGVGHPRRHRGPCLAARTTTGTRDASCFGSER